MPAALKKPTNIEVKSAYNTSPPSCTPMLYIIIVPYSLEV